MLCIPLQATCNSCGADFKAKKQEINTRKYLAKGLYGQDENTAATYAMNKVLDKAHEVYVRSNGRCHVFVATYREGLTRNALAYRGQCTLSNTRCLVPDLGFSKCNSYLVWCATRNRSTAFEVPGGECRRSGFCSPQFPNMPPYMQVLHPAHCCLHLLPVTILCDVVCTAAYGPVATGLSQNEVLLEYFRTAVKLAQQSYQEQKLAQQQPGQQQQQSGQQQQQQTPPTTDQLSEEDKQQLKALLDSVGMAGLLEPLKKEAVTVSALSSMTDTASEYIVKSTGLREWQMFSLRERAKAMLEGNGGNST